MKLRACLRASGALAPLLLGACAALPFDPPSLPADLATPAARALPEAPGVVLLPRWRVAVVPVERSLGGAAWRAAGPRHVLLPASPPGGGSVTAEPGEPEPSGSAEPEPAIPAAGSPGGEPAGLPAVASGHPRNAESARKRAWRRYCAGGEAMSDAEPALVGEGPVPEALRERCRPPK